MLYYEQKQHQNVTSLSGDPRNSSKMLPLDNDHGQDDDHDQPEYDVIDQNSEPLSDHVHGSRPDDDNDQDDYHDQGDQDNDFDQDDEQQPEYDVIDQNSESVSDHVYDTLSLSQSSSHQSTHNPMPSHELSDQYDELSPDQDRVAQNDEDQSLT